MPNTENRICFAIAPMRFSIPWVVLLTGSLCFAQQKTATGVSLAAAKNWSPVAVRIFPASSDKVRFTLTTSWIPGEKSKGSIRYRLIAQRQISPGIRSVIDERTDSLLRRISRCAIFVKLYDADGFLLRSIPIHFDLVVDESTPREMSLVMALNANSASQLSADEYRMLLNGGAFYNREAAERQCLRG